jgi:UDPglucose--hexose-1-phosphate uridylyltransferase
LVKIEFEKREQRAELLDQKEGYLRKGVSFETRKDPLTGHVSRILPFRRRVVETVVSPEVLEASRKGCPFCPGQVDSLTPKFIPEIAPEGRIRKGMAVSFPNSFPYARYNWVVVLSDDHFCHLDQFSTEILKDGFTVAQEGIRRVVRREPEFTYSSINWNYLPQSGGGLYHPHLQVVVDQTPTASQGRVLEGLKNYQLKKNSFYWEDLLSEEMKRGQRYLGQEGDVHFSVAFSPRGILGEINIFFANRPLFDDIMEEDWTHFSVGLNKLFRYLKERQTFSFNLALFSGTVPEVHSWVYARLCPRMLIPPWNTSDINYFEKLHDEIICVISPEEMAEGLKPLFAGQKS